jgi:hypothetical protein
MLIVEIKSPHSLGTLIEWKHDPPLINCNVAPARPHSLGTLIEWKQKDQTKSRIYLVPNKWGLNSCLSLSTHQFIQCSLFPVP